MKMTPEWPARLALVVLTVLAVLTPWPFGGVHLLVAQAIAVAALVTSAIAFACHPAPGVWTPRVVLPLVGLWLVGLFQLLRLPPGLHRLLAPGSAAVWHPSDPVAAAVLGAWPQPLSLHPEATARWLAFTAGLVALAFCASPALRERRAALRVTVVVVAGGVAVAVYGLVARLAFGDKLFGVLAVPTTAPFGPFVSKNHFAGYVEMAACLAVGLAAGLADESRRRHDGLSWLESPRASRVVFAWGAAVVLVLAVAASLSRGGVVSLAAGLVVLATLRTFARGRKPRPRLLIGVAAGLLAAVCGVAWVMPPEARARVLTLANTKGDGPDPFRLGVWHDSLRLATSSPFLGSGFGAYEDALPRFKTAAGNLRVEHAENDDLELLAEAGLLGALLAGFAGFALITGALGRIQDDPHRLSRGLRCGALAGLAALLVHSAFDFNLRIPSNALLFVLLGAMALAPVDHAASDARPRQGAVRGRVRILGGVVLAIATVLAVATPWTEPRIDSPSFQRAARGDTASLRRRSLERDTIARLRRRPADAVAWLHLAWLRWPSSQNDAAALARWGVTLDPQHEALQRWAERVTGTPSSQQKKP